MSSDVTMPRLSDSMEEGTIVRWIVSEGGEVRRGEPLVEIETDKANMTYDADTDGTLVEVLADEGTTLAVGEVIARIGDEAERRDGESAKRSEQESHAGSEQAGAVSESSDGDPTVGLNHSDALRSTESAVADQRVRASPVARRVARELGVQLENLRGSGPGGRILKADVEGAADGQHAGRQAGAEAGPAGQTGQARSAGESGAKGEVTTQELSRMQRTISRRMAESKATAPDFQLCSEIDMSRCVELREQLKQVAEHPPSFNDMVIKACATALREFPRVNGAYRDAHFELYSRVNIGVAVAAHHALVVPTVFDADRKSLGEISGQVRELVTKVGDGKITPPELAGATFTVSNLGMYGIESFTAVINPPQAAILAVGALKKKPSVDQDGQISARDLMTVTLVCDHRILYGADGAAFLARLRKLLEHPLALAL